MVRLDTVGPIPSFLAASTQAAALAALGISSAQAVPLWRPSLWGLWAGGHGVYASGPRGLEPAVSPQAAAQWSDMQGVRPLAGAGKVFAGGLHFDGASQVMQWTATPQFRRRFRVPDVTLGIPGEGFTCTGLAWDALEKCFWVGHDGRTDEGDPTYDPAIIKMSRTGAKLAEILVGPINVNIQSVQGVTVDTSDDTLWFASANEIYVRHITKAGATLGAINVAGGPSGVAYSEEDDALWVLFPGGTLSKFSCATGAQIGSGVPLALGSAYDQLCWDPVAGLVYFTYGINGVPGSLGAYDPVTGLVHGPHPLSVSDNVEGIAIVDGELYNTNDGGFHLGTLTPINAVNIYGWPGFSKIGRQTAFTVVCRVRVTASIGSSTRMLWVLGNPQQLSGLGLFAPGSTTNDIRLSVVTDPSTPGTTRDELTRTLTDRGAWTTISVRVDLVARTYEIRENGVRIGAEGALVNTQTSMRMREFLTVGANPLSAGGFERYCPMGMKCLAVYTERLDDTALAAVEAWMAAI